MTEAGRALRLEVVLGGPERRLGLKACLSPCLLFQSQIFEFWPPGFSWRLYCPIKYTAKLDWYYVYMMENGLQVSHLR